MHLYEKGKRTKKPFGQSVTPAPHVTHEQIKAKECSFNPVLQTYARQEDELRDVFTFQEKRAKSLINHLVLLRKCREIQSSTRKTSISSIYNPTNLTPKSSRPANSVPSATLSTSSTIKRCRTSTSKIAK
jgi:hypothetical protein